MVNKIDLIFKYKNMIINNIEFNNLNKIIYLYLICEIYTKLSKMYILNRKIMEMIKIYRNTIAHGDYLIDSDNDEEYNYLINKLNNNEMDPENMIIRERDIIKNRYITDYEIINFIKNNKVIKDIINNFKIFRLRNIPDSSNFDHERNYLIFYNNIDINILEDIKYEFNIKFNNLINIRLLENINIENESSFIEELNWD